MTNTSKKNVPYRVIVAALLTLTALIVSLSLFKMISPGQVGIVVNLFGDKKGTDEVELGVGMHLVPPWKRVYTFPTYEQNHIWNEDKSFTFQTGEGLNVNADIGISYHLDHDKIYQLFAKYRRNLDEITDVFIRNYARDAINKVASKMKVEDLYGTEKEGFVDTVQGMLRADLGPIGIVVDRLYLIGTLHFPTQVVSALNAKIEATQRAQQRENELREAKAQAEKDIAKATGLAHSRLIQAQAEADANRILASAITSDLIILKAIERWDGKLPIATGNSGMMVPYELLQKPRNN
jgi:regulator of protease activity HflC (stomatin/prohibitin superfamily)